MWVIAPALSSKIWVVSRAQNPQVWQIRMGPPKSIWPIKARPQLSNLLTSQPIRPVIVSSRVLRIKRKRNQAILKKSQKKRTGAMKVANLLNLKNQVIHLHLSERNRLQLLLILKRRRVRLGQLRFLPVQMMGISSLIMLETKSF